MSSCRRLTSAAANKRKTPPYSPSQCAGLTRRGNDGFVYVSTASASGRYRWAKLGAKPKAGPRYGPAFAPRMAPTPSAPKHSVEYENAEGMCKRSFSKKFSGRRTPPYVAGQCPGQALRGRFLVGDVVGEDQPLPLYQSLPDRNGVYRWVLTSWDKLKKIAGLQYFWYK